MIGTTMHFLLFCGILAVILPNSLTVHPGDPFPTDQLKSKTITSEDLINTNEIIDSNDDEISSHSLTDSNSDEDDSMNFIISTSTKPILITKSHHKNMGRINKLFNAKLSSSSSTKPTPTPESHENDDIFNEIPSSSSSEKPSSLSSIKSLCRKNLIKVGRWKHENLQTKTIRYWYEPEGGHMGTGWVFDGFIFQAYNKSELDAEPVYAFHSEVRSIWTNTVQMDPKSPIVGNEQWIADGVSFYAYRTSLNSTELQPVLRYWNKLKPGKTDATETRISYLTMTEAAKGNDDEDGFEWTFDNVLFYALPIDD